MPQLLHLVPLRLRQIVTNGIENAVAFGGGVPGLRAIMRGGDSGDLEIEVLDSGPGLQGRTLEDLAAEFAGLPYLLQDAAAPAARAGGDGRGASAFGNVRGMFGVIVCDGMM